MPFEPLVCLFDIAIVNVVQQSVECRAVIEMDEVGDFMRDH